MSGSYINNKKSIYNYRKKNTTRYNEYMKITMKKRYIWIQIRKEFFNILL